ncbi:MAG: GntP family permease, partial [Saezia sp.]
MTGIMIPALVAISIIAIVLLTAKFKFNVFASLFIVSLVLALCTVPLPEIINLLKSSFGATMGNIAFIIIFGAAIAICMERSGAILSIANAILNKTGKKNAKTAMALTGFIPGMTIFCDTGYIILSGIAKTFSRQSKTPMPLMAGILALSLYAVHCLVPTHPGALFAATELKANIGYLVVFGALFSIPALIVSCWWASKMSKGLTYTETKEDEAAVKVDERSLPPFIISLVPVVLPLLLISFSTLLVAMGHKTGSMGVDLVHFFGNPVMALLMGALTGFWVLFISHKAGAKINVSEILDEAIAKAGPILIITAAGGMFGAVIKATGVGNMIGSAFADASLGLFIPFMIAALLKTAQGSSTAAAIVTSGIVSTMLPSLGLDSEMGRIFAVLAIGAGSVMV